MKEILGDNVAVKYNSFFASAAIGALAGHAADSPLSLWQNGKVIEGWQLMKKGAPMRSALAHWIKGFWFKLFSNNRKKK